jgi:aminoglycoside phosphotransferase (APT) family kinase protein
MNEPLDALLCAAAKAGIECPDVELIRAGENHIYRLGDGIVGRVARPGEAESVARETAVARWLNASGINAVRPVEVEQPIVVGERAVTFWEELPPHYPGTTAQVAAVLKRLHALPVPEQLSHLHLRPFIRLEERITEAGSLSQTDRSWLLGHLEDLKSRWQNLPAGMPECVVHGDAWPGNVVQADGIGITLLDLERCSVGPPEWDLASTAVRYTTFGAIGEHEYREFCVTYGADVARWPGYEILRDIREMRVTCYIIQRANDDPAFLDEARLRLSCLRGTHGPRPWAWTPA